MQEKWRNAESQTEKGSIFDTRQNRAEKDKLQASE